MKKWSLKGITERVFQVDQQYITRAQKAKLLFRRRHIMGVIQGDGQKRLRQLPYPIQRMLADESKASRVMDMIPERFLTIGDEINCDCHFFRAWQLPCKHIFYREHQFTGAIARTDWLSLIVRWEDSECGFGVYEKLRTGIANSVPDNSLQTANLARIELKECLESLHNEFYNLKDSISEIQDLDEGLRALLLNNFVQTVKRFTGEIRRTALGDWVAQLPDDSQKLFSESQERSMRLHAAGGQQGKRGWEEEEESLGFDIEGDLDDAHFNAEDNLAFLEAVEINPITEGREKA